LAKGTNVGERRADGQREKSAQLESPFFVRGLRSWHRISAVSIGRPAYPQEFSSCPREAGINSVLQLFFGVWLSVLFPAKPEQFDRPSTNGAASDPRAADAQKFDLPNVRPPSRIFPPPRIQLPLGAAVTQVSWGAVQSLTMAPKLQAAILRAQS
jgi:hypothetical protein